MLNNQLLCNFYINKAMLIMFIILITKPTFDNKKLENFDF